MSSVTVCARFRPLSSKEKRVNGEKSCIRGLDSETLILKDEKEEEFTFCFDRVFYQESEQADVYEFLALPIVRDAVNAINGTIITYGQTGAGKTYSMEGLGILECHGEQNGLLPRVVHGLFECLKSVDQIGNYTVNLSMVEIYMEKVRDLFDLSKDNLQIKEGKLQGIFLSGVTAVCIMDKADALQNLANGIANRAVGETRILKMNMSSSRSHCVYIFTIQLEMKNDKRVKTGKLILVDLAGSEKVEKTGAEGKLLEEAKTINKSLSALGNVINALTNGSPGKANHIPYRDSKLTRILQDALGGNSRTALLCCCSPSPLNASETLSTLRFGARAKLIRTSPRVIYIEDKVEKKEMTRTPVMDVTPTPLKEVTPTAVKEVTPTAVKDESCERILTKLRETMDDEDVKLLEKLFILEGIFFDPNSVEESETAYEDAIFRTISSLQQTVEELACTVNKLKRENMVLKAKVAASQKFIIEWRNAEEKSPQYNMLSNAFRSLSNWVIRR